MRRGMLAALCALALGCGSGTTVPGAGFGPDGGVTQTFQDEVVALAQFDGTSGHGTAPDTESFDGTGSHASSGATVSCHWDFGDGASSEQCRTTHVFSQPGTFTVTLTAKAPDGNQGTASLTVLVDPPSSQGVVAVAKLDGTPGHGTAPDTERFDGTGSHSNDPAASLASCSWDFGDGEGASGCKASHTFTRAGSFTVTLTAKDSNGDRGSASLGVTVTAPTVSSSEVRWARSTPDTTLVGSDSAGRAAIAYRAQLEGIDPDSGATRSSHSYASPPEATSQFEFWGPMFISPATGEIFAQTYITGPTNARGDCVFTADGASDEGCYVHGMDSYLVMAPQMASDGTTAGGAGTYHVNEVFVRRPDGTTWSASLRGDADPVNPPIVFDDVAAEAGGDAVVAGNTDAGFQWDGQPVGPGRVLMRLAPDGKLVWWRPLPFKVLDLGTSAAGTVVGIGAAAKGFTWADQTLSAGTYLFIVDSGGTSRLVRKLDDAATGSLSVLPKGQVGIALGRAGCSDHGGAIVYRYDLAGDRLFRTDFGRSDCAVQAWGISIRAGDLLVSGKLTAPVDFGTGALPAGGFVLDLDG